MSVAGTSSDCAYTTAYLTTMQNHVEAKHVNTAGFLCHVCNKFCPSKNALKSHVSRSHKINF
jgi:Pyruvate/2-oxoacid:ferredoxin oxidoreductase delta subunit